MSEQEKTLARIAYERFYRGLPMRINLAGLINNAQQACKKGDKKYGNLFAYSLEELESHIRATVRGEHTLEEFAEHYCIEKSSPVEVSK